MVHGDQMHGSVSAAHRCRGNGPNESTGDAELGEWLKLGGGGGRKFRIRLCVLATATAGGRE